MRRVRVPLSALREGPLELSREAAHYLCVVHRLAPGASFLAFDVERAVEADATLTAVERGRARCEVSALRAAESGSLGVRLLQSAAKGDRLEQVVRAATALGAESVSVVQSERSVTEPGALRFERLRSVALDAARQSGRGDVPALLGPLELERALAEASPAALRICLAPGAERPLANLLTSWRAGEPAVVLIGPEGGLSSAELARASAAGFALAALGRLTLRTELAAVAALACFASKVG